MKTIAVLGAGASGYAAAITAARTRGVRVVLINAAGRTARKVLASGNGRCNLGNRHVTVDCYQTAEPSLLQPLLARGDMVARFWQQCGVLTRTDAEGRIYPWSNRAQTVADALVLAARNAGVQMRVGTVLDIEGGARWRVHTDAGDVEADAVVVALGNKAAPSLGATDTGLQIAARLGIPTAAARPSLVPLRTTPHHASVKGCRQFARVTLVGEKGNRTEEGEVLFTEYGLSGIAVMQLSAYLGGKDKVLIDMLPTLCAEEIMRMLSARVRSGAYPTVDVLLIGILDRALAYAVLKDAGISPLDFPTAALRAEQLSALCSTLKGWQFTVDGTQGYEAAQVAAGGVLLSALDDSLQSKAAGGVYFCGEVVDVTGLSGGYNLHWAWLSGLIAGASAVGHLGNS